MTGLKFYFIEINSNQSNIKDNLQFIELQFIV